jgi:hypothetical protein
MKSIELTLYGMNFQNVKITWNGLYFIEAISEITETFVFGDGGTLDEAFKSFTKEYKRQANIKFLGK